MEHIAKTIPPLGESVRHQPIEQLPTRIIDKFWERMAEIYGHKWVSSYGETDADGTWAKGLADMTGQDLKQGFKVCMTNGEPWPPSLPQFREMCKPPKRENESMYRLPPDRQLPHTLSPERRQTGRDHIKNLKRSLGK